MGGNYSYNLFNLRQRSNRDAQTHISFPITVIHPASKPDLNDCSRDLYIEHVKAVALAGGKRHHVSTRILVHISRARHNIFSQQLEYRHKISTQKLNHVKIELSIGP